MKPVFLMSPPRTDWHLKGRANFRSQQAQAPDAARARKEWSTLAGAVVEAGGEVLVLPPHPQQALTGMIYTAEAGEFFQDADGRWGVILPNMAGAHRQGEAPWIERFVTRSLGLPAVRIESTWEAQGDAIRAGQGLVVHTWGQGPYARTARGAYQEVAQMLSARHIQLKFDADPWFHGNTFLNVYHHEGQRLVLVCPDALGPQGMDALVEATEGAQVVEISVEDSRAYDTNALQVRDTVLASATMSARTKDALRAFGLEVVELDLSELFLKGGGAPVCLTNRLWGMDPDALPEGALWSKHPRIEHHEALGRALWAQHNA